MNIAILHYSVPPIVGGVESVVGHHARLMAKHGHSVKLIAARGESMGEKIQLARIPLADSRHERVAEMKNELDQGKVTNKFESLRDDLIKELKSVLVDVDVLIAHNVCSLNKNLALTAALHELHKSGELPRFIIWHHDLAWTTPRYLPEMHEGHPWDLLRTDWGNTIHVVVSELRCQELAKLMKIESSSIKLVPNGVDTTRFYKLEEQTQSLLEKTNLLDAEPILLLPVRVTPRKNIELAIRTLSELKKQYPNAALVVTGPLGPHNVNNIKYFEQLTSLRAELGLQDSMHFLAELVDAFLPDEVIADFFRVADALLFPSREEGFGIPLIEAGFSHLPAFCADIPPLYELGLGDVAFFPSDEEPERIASLIADHFKSSLTARWSMRARSSYRWEAIYKLHIQHLLEKE